MDRATWSAHSEVRILFIGSPPMSRVRMPVGNAARALRPDIVDWAPRISGNQVAFTTRDGVALAIAWSIPDYNRKHPDWSMQCALVEDAFPSPTQSPLVRSRRFSRCWATGPEHRGAAAAYLERGRPLQQRIALVTDVRGSVRLAVDVDSGAVLQRIATDPFGVELSRSGVEPWLQPLGYAGGRVHDAARLVGCTNTDRGTTSVRAVVSWRDVSSHRQGWLTPPPSRAAPCKKNLCESV